MNINHIQNFYLRSFSNIEEGLRNDLPQTGAFLKKGKGPDCVFKGHPIDYSIFTPASKTYGCFGAVIKESC